MLCKRSLPNTRHHWGAAKRDYRWTSKQIFTKSLEIRFGELIKKLFTAETEYVDGWAFLELCSSSYFLAGTGGTWTFEEVSVFGRAGSLMRQGISCNRLVSQPRYLNAIIIIIFAWIHLKTNKMLAEYVPGTFLLQLKPVILSHAYSPFQTL